jgi:hypothetical protein
MRYTFENIMACVDLKKEDSIEWPNEIGRSTRSARFIESTYEVCDRLKLSQDVLASQAFGIPVDKLSGHNREARLPEEQVGPALARFAQAIFIASGAVVIRPTPEMEALASSILESQKRLDQLKREAAEAGQEPARAAARAHQEMLARKRGAALATLSERGRALVKVLLDRKDAFGCNREDAIKVLSAVLGEDITAAMDAIKEA